MIEESQDNPRQEKMKKWNFLSFGQIIIGIHNLITSIKAVYAMAKACLIKPRFPLQSITQNLVHCMSYIMGLTYIKRKPLTSIFILFRSKNPLTVRSSQYLYHLLHWCLPNHTDPLFEIQWQLERSNSCPGSIRIDLYMA